MIAVDLFTECLRWFVWVVLGLLFMTMLGVGLGTASARWLRRWELRHGWQVYDWSRDGECDEPLETEDMYPRTHVSVPDGVPRAWLESWQ